MEELSALLTSPSGSFFYQLALLLVVFGTIIVIYGRRNPVNLQSADRMARGMYGLLLLRLGLTAAALIFAAGSTSANTFLWMERGLTTAGWILLIWLWAFPQPAKKADTGTGLLAIFTVTIAFLSVGLQIRQSVITPWLQFAWAAFSILILLTGVVLLLRKKPELYGYGLSMLSILLLAEITSLLMTSGGPLQPHILRLAAIAAYPILLTLPQRIRIEIPTPVPPQPLIRRALERKRINLPPGVYGKFLSLATETDLLKLSRGITETVSFAMVADICLMVSRPTPQDEIIIYCGYDQVLEQEIMGAQIAARHLPMVASAIQKHSPLRLPASSASSDLKHLSASLHLPKSGHLLVAPIRTAADLGVGALILLTPYSTRTWTQDDQTYLSLAAEKVGLLLEQSQTSTGMMQEIEALRSKLAQVRTTQGEGQPQTSRFTEKFGSGDTLEAPLENTELLRALEEAAYRQQELESELASLRENNEQLLAERADDSWNQTIQNLQAENIQLQLTVHELEAAQDEQSVRTENYKAAHKESLLLIEQLHDENERLRKEIQEIREQPLTQSPNGKSGKSENDIHPEAELKEALREIAHLKNLLGESEIKIIELENLSSASSNTSRQWEMIITLAEEMRQPMSSILGYSDFLLTESVGLLGTLQRKFLERVKASTNRMSAMIEDLIHIAASESGKLKLNIGQVDLTSVVDSAIAASTVQMREKTISLLVNLPDDLPTIEGDREAIRLTLIHLLHNATAATPNQGKITIEIESSQTGSDDDYIQIRVSDTGGGISTDDMPKIFDRRFKSRDELIKGLGVSSSGLSIAKTLVEAHGGRIWVENRDEEGATFFVLLPMRQEISETIFGERSQ